MSSSWIENSLIVRGILVIILIAQNIRSILLESIFFVRMENPVCVNMLMEIWENAWTWWRLGCRVVLTDFLP